MAVSENIRHQFTFRPSWKSLLLVPLGLILGAFMSFEALNNNKRLLINGIVELSAGQATVFFWCFAAFMFAIAFLGVLALVQRLSGPLRIALTDSGVWVPGPVWAKADRFYEFAGMKTMKIVTIYNATILQVDTLAGRFAIAQPNLESPEDFERIVELIKQSVARKRGA